MNSCLQSAFSVLAEVFASDGIRLADLRDALVEVRRVVRNDHRRAGALGGLALGGHVHPVVERRGRDRVAGDVGDRVAGDAAAAGGDTPLRPQKRRKRRDDSPCTSSRERRIVASHWRSGDEARALGRGGPSTASRVTASSTSAALHDGREPLRRVLGNPDRKLRLARLVQRLGDLGAQPLGADRVELDRRHREPVAAERDRPRARPGRA